MTPELATRRLLLRPLELADAGQVQILFPHGEIVRYLANTVPWRISEKGGMRMVATEEREYVSGRLMSEIWEITAEEWRARRGRQANRPRYTMVR